MVGNTPLGKKTAQKRNLNGTAAEKRWTEEETEFLKENWGKMSTKDIGDKLGKTAKCVRNRACYIGLGPSFDASKHLTLANVFKALYGYSYNKDCIKRLEEKGFPFHVRVFNKKRYRLVDPEKMWKWLKVHQDEFDFVEFTEYSLGAEPDWVRVKRKADWARYNQIRWGLARP